VGEDCVDRRTLAANCDALGFPFQPTWTQHPELRISDGINHNRTDMRGMNYETATRENAADKFESELNHHLAGALLTIAIVGAGIALTKGIAEIAVSSVYRSSKSPSSTIKNGHTVPKIQQMSSSRRAGGHVVRWLGERIEY
jgi:hypothetical protein